MMLALLPIVFILSAYLQAELLDINPFITMLADAPTLGLLLFLFNRQMNHHERITKSLLSVLSKQAQTDDDE